MLERVCKRVAVTVTELSLRGRRNVGVFARGGEQFQRNGHARIAKGVKEKEKGAANMEGLSFHGRRE